MAQTHQEEIAKEKDRFQSENAKITEQFKAKE